MIFTQLETRTQALAARLHQPESAPKAAVVVAHGLFSSMASAKLTRLCQALAQAGCLVMAYDSLGCGESPGKIEDTTLEARCGEVLAAAEHLSGLAPGVPLIYVGSSLGGSASLAAAIRRPPARLALWSTPIDLTRLKARLRQDPAYARMTALAQEEFPGDLERLLPGIAGALWVHGQEDEVVPVEQAVTGHKLCAAPKDVLLLPGADHRLSRIADQDMAIQRTLSWVLPNITIFDQ